MAESMEMGENMSREWNVEPCASHLWDLLNLIRSGNTTELQSLKNLALEGSGLAAYYVGYLLEYGVWNVAKSSEAAQKWLERSWRAGSIEGGFLLAKILHRRGNYSKALSLFNQLGERNFSPALYYSALYHINGFSVEKDVSKAIQLFQLAYINGHVYSGHWISNLLRDRSDIGSKIRGWAMVPILILRYLKIKAVCASSDSLRQ